MIKFRETMTHGGKKGPMVGSILEQCVKPKSMEYLFNSMRYICRNETARGGLCSSGTSGNEAMHAEMKTWVHNLRSYHQDRLNLALRAFLIGKMIAFFMRVNSIPTISFRQSEILNIVSTMLFQWKMPLYGTDLYDPDMSEMRTHILRPSAHFVGEKKNAHFEDTSPVISTY